MSLTRELRWNKKDSASKTAQARQCKQGSGPMIEAYSDSVGSGLPLRVLGPQDRSAFLAHLLRLSPQDRYSRFSRVASDTVITSYVQDRFNQHAYFFGMFDHDILRGVVELHCMDEVCTQAELAFSIEGAWRGKGWGRRLCQRALLEARQHHIKQLHIHCLAHNFAMLALAREAKARLVIEDQEAAAVITLEEGFEGMTQWAGMSGVHL